MRILFYPELPKETAVIHKFCTLRNWEMTNDATSHYDLVFNWEDTTHRTQGEVLQKLKQTYRVFNAECADISKLHIDQAHHAAFGYGVLIDPVVFSGLAVQKSDQNYAHNGRIITCPISVVERDTALAEGSVFARLLTTSTPLPQFENKPFARDIRVPYMNGEVPFCYLGFRDLEKRFGFTKVYVEFAETNAVLTPKELEQIRAFCKNIGFEYGELDVLRNQDDGLIYIVDANTTPGGPQKPLPEEKTLQALGWLADSFERNFLTA